MTWWGVYVVEVLGPLSVMLLVSFAIKATVHLLDKFTRLTGVLLRFFVLRSLSLPSYTCPYISSIAYRPLIILLIYLLPLTKL